MSEGRSPINVDFVPAWYPRLRRRRRSAAVFALTCCGLTAAVASFAMRQHAAVQAAEVRLAADSRRLTQSRRDVISLDQLTALRADLGRRRQVLGGLGVKVEPTRLLSQLETALPADVSLLGLTLSTDDSADASSAKSSQPSPLRPADAGKQLSIRLQGVAPSDLQVAELLNRLSAVPFFQQVAMSYARDRIDNGHILREFEVGFRIDLEAAGGSP